MIPSNVYDIAFEDDNVNEVRLLFCALDVFDTG